MWHVRFGKQDDRIRELATHIDRDRFDWQVGELRATDISGFDCVVPLDLPDYDAIRWNEGHWGKTFWSPHPDHVRLCDDKLALNRLLLDGEFAALVPPLRETDSDPFPYVLKKRRDEWGRHSHLIRDREDERMAAELLTSPDYFRQAYVPGHEEYAVHVLMVDNSVRYAQTVKYDMASAGCIKGQGAVPQSIAYLPADDHLAVFARLLATIGYSGTCCIDYKMDNGRPMLMEINPRVGASLIPDINRYLEAYLRSLGLSQKRVWNVLRQVLKTRRK
jgi:glutathione synthase/RimK-type ligase-like ATP-grasp enzyme